ncbi:ribosomal protein L10e/L16, partial [Piptocephalis cylindrospora]
PRRFRSRKSQKGRIPVPLGGSTAGTSLQFGTFGLRVLQGSRLKAATLHAAQTTLKRKLKAVKGAQIWTRVFPATPITSKGNETRMGKGKGAFDHWAVRVPQNRILFEIGGPDLHDQVARDALKQVTDKLPVRTEFVVR